MTIQDITLDKLVPSKSNVRKVKPSRIEGLAESILVHGLLQNLQVKPIEDGKYEVIAGGRRLEALKLLAKTKRIEATFPVSCRIVEGDNLHEISLVENEQREQMHPADQFDAFKKLADEGMGEETIAARFGVTPTVVKQRLKLAVVSPKLVAMYRNGAMTLEQLMAFTLSDDHKEQEKVWKELPSWARERGNDQQIRNVLTKAMIDPSNELAKFVTLKAYKAAGGAIVSDLFAEDSSAFLTDVALLQKLVDEKLQKVAQEVRAEGWSWVEIALKKDYQALSRYGRVYPTVSAENDAKVSALREEMDALDEETENYEERYEELDGQIDALQDAAAFTDADKARAGAFVSIDRNGKALVERGFITPEQVKADKKSVPGKDGQDVDTQKPEFSSALIERLSSHKTAALQARLAADPKIALVAVVHALIASTSPEMCLSPVVKVRGTTTYLAEEIEQGVAGIAFAKVSKSITKGVPEDGDKLWHWLIKQNEKKLLELLAVCAASCVNVIEKKGGERVNAEAAKQLAEALKLDMADYWQPTAAEYFERVSKPQALEAIKEVCGTDGTVEVAHLKKGELAKRAEKLMAGKRWLPPILQA